MTPITEDEYFFDPEKKIPTLKYLFDEGFIGFDIEVEEEEEENRMAIIIYDLTNLGVDSSFDEKNKILTFKLVNEILNITIHFQKFEDNDEDNDEEEE